MLFHYVIFDNCVWGNHYTVMGIITSFLMVNQGWLFEFAPAINNPIWYICVLLWLYLLYYFIEYTFKIAGGEAKILLYCSIALIGGVGWHFSLNLPFFYLSDCRGYATVFLGIVVWHLLNRVRAGKKSLRNISVLIIVAALFYCRSE